MRIEKQHSTWGFSLEGGDKCNKDDMNEDDNAGDCKTSGTVTPVWETTTPPEIDSNMKNKQISNSWSVGINSTQKDMLDDDAHLKVSYSPGKKGGNFGLPLGAKLTVPEGLFGKKDSISCQVAPPSQRWRHSPVLPYYEHLTSEIFILNSTVHPLKKSVIVRIPYYQIDSEHNEINVKGKWKDEEEWVNVGFLHKSDTSSPCIELEIDRLGVFVVTFTPKKETFEVTTQGCLYNAHMSKYISVRVPKKAAEKNFQCAIQITPITEEKVKLAKEFYPFETSELENVSEIIDLIPNFQCTFRRAVSVKLPLPANVEVENESANTDIAVLAKLESGWELVDTKYRFTRTTVTCDVKSLTRFCVVKSKPDRKKRMAAAVSILEGRCEMEKGEVMAFINFQEKTWFLVLECFPKNKLDSKIAEMKEKGFRHFKKEISKPEEPVDNKQHFRRPPPIKTKSQNVPVEFEIFDGLKWTFNVSDDLKANLDSDYMENKDLQYYKHLPESLRKFVIEPKTTEERTLIGAINLTPVGINDQKVREASTMALRIEVDEETVKAYFHEEVIPEEPEVKKEKPNLDLLRTPEIKVDKPTTPFTPKFKPLPASVMERLMRTSRPQIIIERESKAITGKSLRNLSKYVPEGLTLAVHLDLPDSTITGIGFDAISNGLSMADVTYKILLYWKRTRKDKKDLAVEMLADALREMGRVEAAHVVQECHKNSKEVTPEIYSELLSKMALS